jgi:hypothetical protein
MLQMRMAAVGLLFGLVAGCGPSGPELVPVTGTVMLDGKPLGLKNIYFSPDEGTPGAGAGGNSKADGTFELLAVVGGAVEDMPGAPVGKYRVVVAEPMFPIETEMAVQGESDQPEVAVGLPSPPKKADKMAIPSIYSNKDTTPLRVEVKPGGSQLTLELSTKG